MGKAGRILWVLKIFKSIPLTRNMEQEKLKNKIEIKKNE